MEFKKNLNMIHYLLSEKFESVEVSEKSNLKLGNYIEFSIKEDLECRVLIKKKDLESNRFKWLYCSNPLIEESNFIERSSTVETFVGSVDDIIKNKRFDSEYIKIIG